MVNGKRKYEVSDPAFFDSLIAEQKSRIGRNPDDAELWLELGRIREAKIDMTNYFASRNFWIRYSPFIAFLLVLGTMGFLYFKSSFLCLISWKFLVPVYIVPGFSLIWTFIWMWFLRYPPSGNKYFRKAIKLNPKCGDAYTYLGLIALRRYQTRKACWFWEKALRLNVNNKGKIEKELKSIYEKEFAAFFQKRSEKKIRQKQIIEHQLDQIRQLRTKNVNLEKRVESLSAKVEQAKWETGHKTKLLDKKMQHQIATIRQEYEDKIALLQKEAKEEAKELGERDFMRLTTEIMESKAALEEESFATVAVAVENIVGKRSWQAFSEQTRLYLATAEHVYTVLTKQDEKPDYSLVGMELCKALETEVNQRLVESFATYLNGNKSEFLRIHQTGESKDRPSYFTYLAKVVDHANYPEVTSLTLGQYNFVLKLTLENDYALKEYGNFLDWVCATSGAIIGKTFLSKLETVVKRYRNMIAHQSSMNKKQYDHLKELVFSGDDALLNICCEIGSRNFQKMLKVVK